jgi:transcriptional regulator with XRE-family HTH domain
MKLADVRHSKGYTQKEIADRCGLSVSTISNIESGENSYTTRSLIMYAEALGYELSIKRKED